MAWVRLSHGPGFSMRGNDAWLNFPQASMRKSIPRWPRTKRSTLICWMEAEARSLESRSTTLDRSPGPRTLSQNSLLLINVSHMFLNRIRYLVTVSDNKNSNHLRQRIGQTIRGHRSKGTRTYVLCNHMLHHCKPRVMKSPQPYMAAIGTLRKPDH